MREKGFCAPAVDLQANKYHAQTGETGCVAISAACVTQEATQQRMDVRKENMGEGGGVDSKNTVWQNWTHLFTPQQVKDGILSHVFCNREMT